VSRRTQEASMTDSEILLRFSTPLEDESRILFLTGSFEIKVKVLSFPKKNFVL
jgi:hypothetical protein